MDPYVYPATTVLRNLRNIRDARQFTEFEAEATYHRTFELEHRPIQGRFDVQHLQIIHRYIFQDIFDWAGEFRAVNISKPGAPFAFFQHIVASIDKLCAELTREFHLAELDVEGFIVRGAWYLGELNAIHPFREGNGRTQREFIRQLGRRNGLTIDWTHISQQEMIEASQRSLLIDTSGLEHILRKALNR